MATEQQSETRRTLASRLADAFPDGEFDVGRFFEYWFRGGGGASYFFLFKKNLRVTNLQFAELLALLRIYSSKAGVDTSTPDLLFVTTDHFKRTVRELMTALLPSPRERERMEPAELLEANRERAKLFEQLYALIFERTVVVDAFHGSCVVFVPPTLDLDLRGVCAASGYIHSCGSTVWVRRASKSDGDELVRRLERQLEPLSDQPRFFAVYAHEDFTQFDRELASELREGLDDVKVWVEKFWIGEHRLGTALQHIAEKLALKLVVADPGDYRSTRKKLLEARQDLDRTRCYWLLLDNAVTPDGSGRAPERFYLCYEQLYKNSNPFHAFDENKPGWRAHTTLPHTLTGAMINIALPYCDLQQKVKLCDPFVGSGTTLLEAAKFPTISASGGDLDPLVPLLAADNASFFALGPDELRAIVGDLRQTIRLLEDGDGPAAETDESPGPRHDDEHLLELYDEAETSVAPLKAHPDRELSLDQIETAALAERQLLGRLFFYLGLRSVRRSVGARQVGSNSYAMGWAREAQVLVQQIRQIIKSYEQEPHAASTSRVRVWVGDYSLECSPSEQILKELGTVVADRVEVADACELPENAYDLIVTDPPYGFNTDDDPRQLAELYRTVLERLLRALRPGGQLVLALPERSYTGRETGYFTRREFVDQLIGAVAHDLGLDLLETREVVPTTPDVFRGPYYWESERALRRAVLHYRVLPRPRSSDTAEFAAVREETGSPSPSPPHLSGNGS